MISKFLQLGILIVFTATSGIAGPRVAPVCLHAAIEIGKYEQPPVKIPRQVLAKVESQGFDFEGTHFVPGTIVDVSFKGELSNGELPIEKLTPGAVSGPLVGTKKNKAGENVLVVDMGRGYGFEIPVREIRTVGLSTQRVEPSTYGVYERALVHGGIIGKQVFPVVSMGLTTLGYFSIMKPPVDFFLKTVAESPGLALVGAAAAASLTLRTKIGRKVWNGVSVVGDVVANYWWRPWVPVQALKYMLHVEETKLFDKQIDDTITELRMLFKTIPVKPSSIGRDFDILGGRSARLLEDTDGVRLLALNSDEPLTEEFINQAKEAFKDVIATKKYMQKIGSPEPEGRVGVWLTPKPLPGISDYVGPAAYANTGFIVMAPHAGRSAREVAKKFRDPRVNTRVAENIVGQKLILDGNVQSHEMVHIMMTPHLKEGYEFGLISEGTADYFVYSALNRPPEIAVDAVVEGYPLRESVERKYPPGKYPAHLNFNSYAQLNAGQHTGSQVLTRFLWRLRERFGRELLDPVAYQAAMDPEGFHPKGENKPNLATEIYGFTSSLIRIAKDKKLPAQFEDAVLAEAKAIGLAPEIVRSMAMLRPNDETPTVEIPAFDRPLDAAAALEGSPKN